MGWLLPGRSNRREAGRGGQEDLDPRKQPIPPEIWILVAAAFLIALGFGLIAPILPQYARSFDVGVFAASFVVSSFAIFRLLFAPVSGRLVNSLGYRRTYLTGLSIVAVSTLLVGIASDYWTLLLFRALGGIGSTMFTVSAMGLIVRISPPAIRGKCSAAYGSAFLLGNVFGPMLGAAMGAWGMRVPFFIYGGTLLLATLLVGLQLSAEHLRHMVPQRTTPVMTFGEAIRDSAYRSAIVAGFSNGWSNFGVRVAIIPLFAAAMFSQAGKSAGAGSGEGAGPVVADASAAASTAATATATAGFALTAFALGNVIALQFSGRLSDRIGRKPLILAGLTINGIFTASMGFTQAPIALLLISALAGCGAGMLNPSLQASLADVIGADRQGGRVLANYQMAQDLGAIAGPLIVGAIVDVSGFNAGFIACGIISAIALVVTIFGRESMDTAANCAPKSIA